MSTPCLEDLRDCMDGDVPVTLATCAPDGTPNVTYVSHVHFVDAGHVALSFQFFNKTRENILQNPRATALVIHPKAGTQYRFELEYLTTEVSGPIFESMKARLAGIASHTGMSGVFRLLGSDIYRVLEVTQVPGTPAPELPVRRDLLAAVRDHGEKLGTQADLEAMLEHSLEVIERRLGIRHSMILMADHASAKLFTVASRGYTDSGIGSEIPFGCGVVGVSAAQRVPVRISHMAAEYSYGKAIRESMLREGMTCDLETAIPFPGLANSASQVAVPVVAVGELLGVLFAESAEDTRFAHDDEDALVAIAAQLSGAILALRVAGDSGGPAGRVEIERKTIGRHGATIPVRHYAADDSIFIGDDYLIKGVAGAIFAKLLSDHRISARTEFSNRELRLDPALRLPDITDNLEARLVLLERRLIERSAPMRIEKTGRGRFRLEVRSPFTLEDIPERHAG